MIYDCFSFFNELDLLDLRLHELNAVVDKFVLVEATVTHSGLPKPLYYEENKNLFAEFHDKIIHIVVDDMPMEPEEIEAAITPQDRTWLATGYQLGDDWVRERYQRNAIMQGLNDCDENDIIIISDADEIVRPSTIASLPQTLVDGSNAVEQTLNTYYLNIRCTNMPWWGSKILRRKFVYNPSEHRFHTRAAKYLYKGGWHFNFWGGPEAIREKIKAYAHQEFNNPGVLNNIENQLMNNKDVLGREYQYAVVPLDDSLPRYVLDNLAKFDKHIYRPT